MFVLATPKHRVPLANYVELVQAGIELCNEPALALLTPPVYAPGEFAVFAERLRETLKEMPADVGSTTRAI